MSASPVDIKSLQYFIAVYEAGGFARASASLHTVQSNVSARILRLERKLGVPLFARYRRGTSPTEHGDRLYRHAKQVLRMVEDIQRSVHRLDDAAARRALD
jgi:LysR family nitrogen assimilation transcriptional regulator